jgi:hypothetical protein
MIRTKTSWSLSLAVIACLWAGAAHAAAKRVGVPAFDGVQEALVRKKVMAVLQAHGFDLVKSRQIESTLQSLGTRLDSNDGFQALAKELSLQAIVTGEVGKKRAKIVVYDGREGSAIADATFAGANPAKLAAEVGRGFWKRLGAAVEKGHVPAGAKKSQKVVADAPEDAPDSGGAAEPSEEAPAKKKAVVAENEDEGGAKKKAKGEEEGDGEKKAKKKEKDKDQEEESAGPVVIPPTLDVSAGGGLLIRDYKYHQPVSKLRPYKLAGAPAVTFNLVWYPISYLTDGLAQQFGLELHIEQAFAISSAIGPGDADFPNGAKFNTVVHDYSGGLRFRVPFGDGSQFYVSATAGEQAFVFRSTSNGDRGLLDIPDTIYRYFRPGLGVKVELPYDLSLEVNAGYRMILNGGGQIKDVFFPHLAVGGVEAGVIAGYRILPNVEIRAAFDFRRYFFSMNSKPEDLSDANKLAGVRVAGGAIDQYMTFTGALAFLLGGTEKGAASEEAVAAPKASKASKASKGDEEEGGDDEGGGGE